MKICLLPGFATLLFLLANPALAQKPAAPQGFEAFKMVRTRNIFDPDRRPPPSQNAAAAAVPIAQSDYVALTGTLVTDDKALAFFSGSRADFDKVLPLKEKIAGATITKIQPGSVTIERAGKAVTVAVGWTVPLNGAASAPAPAPPAEMPALSTAIGSGSASASASPVATGVPATANVAGVGIPLPFGGVNSQAGSSPDVRPAAAAAPVATPNPDVARMMRERRQREVP